MQEEKKRGKKFKLKEIWSLRKKTQTVTQFCVTFIALNDNGNKK